MDSTAVLEMMKGYFTDRLSPEELAAFSELSPRGVLKESLDVVDFLVYLEEQLEREIDINQIGEAVLSDSFGALSDEVSRLLGERA